MQSGCIETIDMTVSRPKPQTSYHSGLLPAVIDSVGTESFAPNLLKYLDQALGGVDHCALYRLDGERPTKLGAASLTGSDNCDGAVDVYLSGHWHGDPLMQKIRDMPFHRQPALTRMDLDCLPPSGLRDLVFRRLDGKDRLMLSSSRGHRRIGCSMVRSDPRGMMPDDRVDAVVETADLVVTMVAKHAELSTRREAFEEALASTAEIAATMSKARVKLTNREVEVCARTLFGLSSHSTGLELGIGEESVKTYRKRAYQRIGISSARELLVWYLGISQQRQIPRPDFIEDDVLSWPAV
ncbi:helix-turn-helix transcriptional regulator [Rhizorhapis suberifaciens]|uniref:DNA-binding CsgD family transcriptional regulator n=1 Tax=Rhizorhapis suberifaciens TaxID=13656 RepID=A0A840HU53_9SPHN|nr:helix-turn-helix transcriptional regulator [Rhizorhapis suberifaciens]MBB4641453.1 DNA-binding CsgD family transcriptional regulator [Rhizorhapis suberifaciens]